MRKKRFGIDNTDPNNSTFGMQGPQGPGLPATGGGRYRREPGVTPGPSGPSGPTDDPECYTEVCTFNKSKTVDYSYMALERQDGALTQMGDYAQKLQIGKISRDNPFFKFTGEWNGFSTAVPHIYQFMAPGLMSAEANYEKFLGAVAPQTHFNLDFLCKKDVSWTTNPPYTDGGYMNCCPETPDCRAGWDNQRLHNDADINHECHCCESEPGYSIGEIKREVISTHNDIKTVIVGGPAGGFSTSQELVGQYIDFVKYTITMTCNHIWKHYAHGKFPGEGPPDCPSTYTMGAINLTTDLITRDLTDDIRWLTFPGAAGSCSFNYKLADEEFDQYSDSNVPEACNVPCELHSFALILGTTPMTGNPYEVVQNESTDYWTGDYAANQKQHNWPFYGRYRLDHPHESPICTYIKDARAAGELKRLLRPDSQTGDPHEDFKWCDICVCDDEHFAVATKRCCGDKYNEWTGGRVETTFP